VSRRTLRACASAVAASVALSACAVRQAPGGTETIPASAGAELPLGHRHSGSGSSPIQHVVLIIQENRTFNNLFAGFKGAVSSKTGNELVKQGTGYVEEPITLKAIPLSDVKDITHRYTAFLTAWQNGAMDGFSLIKAPINGKLEGTAPYVYVEKKDIKPYWAMAEQWGLADEMFQTQGSDSFTAHQDLVRGGTFIDANDSLIDPPTTSGAWGCDSPPGSKTSTINTQLQPSYGTGPFPCTSQFPDYPSNGYPTLRDVLDAKGVSWKYYTPVWKADTTAALWNAFDVIAPVRYGSEWTTNVSSPEKNILTDISSGQLPAMSWVIPDSQDSDHPGYPQKDKGPSWVASVVNAIGTSQYWNSTAIIVVWDDWGGFYDPVAPPMPRDNQGGPGFRVPMIVISPYTQLGTDKKGGYVSHTVYSFGSILRFTEDTFGLARLGTTDGTCTSIADMFNFTQSPRSFKLIPAEHGKEYFLHQKPSNLPVDTE
jgi:phospholipase C